MFLKWSLPKLPTANLWTSERRESIRYSFNTLRLQILLPAATNPVSQANTAKEHIQRGTQSGKPGNSLHTLFTGNIKKIKSRKTHFGRYPEVTLSWHDSHAFIHIYEKKKIQTKQVQGNTVFLKLNYSSAYDPFYYIQTEIKCEKLWI